MCQFPHFNKQCKLMKVVKQYNMIDSTENFEFLQNNSSVIAVFEVLSPISIRSYNTCPMIMRFCMIYEKNNIEYNVVQSIDS